jgi:hypothetical protein
VSAAGTTEEPTPFRVKNRLAFLQFSFATAIADLSHRLSPFALPMIDYRAGRAMPNNERANFRMPSALDLSERGERSTRACLKRSRSRALRSASSR